MFNEIYISGEKHKGYEIDIAEDNIRKKSEKSVKVKEPAEVVAEIMRTLKLHPYHFKKIKKCYFGRKSTGGQNEKIRKPT